MRFKHILKTTISSTSVIALGALFILSPIAASADSSGGSGSGGVGSAGSWLEVSGKNNTQEAWNKFVWHGDKYHDGNTWIDNYRKSSVYNAVNHAGNNAGKSNLASLCMRSQYIWFYVNTDNSYNSWINPWNTGYNVPGPLHGTSWNWEEWNSAMRNGAQGVVNGHHADIICSAAYIPPHPDRQAQRTETQNQPFSQNDDSYLSGIYSTYTQVTPLMPSGLTANEQSDWMSTHENQGNVNSAQYSTFGNWYNSNINTIKSLDNRNNNDLTNTYNNLSSSGTQALNPNNIPNQSISLSKLNQQGFSAGGIFNIVQQAKYAYVDLHKTRNYTRTRTRTVKYTETWNGSKYVEKNGSEQPGPWSNWKDTLVSVNKNNKAPTAAQLSSYETYKAWQIIHAQCNQAGLNAAKNAAGLTELSNQTTQGTMKTKVYNNTNDFPLGNQNNSNQALSATSTANFFYGKLNADGRSRSLNDSSCVAPITCLSAKTSSNDSDSANNVQNHYGDYHGYSPNGTYGAQGDSSDSTSTKMSSDKFTFFRDNSPHTIRLDLWYLGLSNDWANNSGITVDKNASAIESNFVFDSNGTPKNTLFKVSDTSGNLLLNGSDIADGRIENTDSELNKLKVSGAWASDANAPQKFNASWAYTANLHSVIPIEVDSDGNMTQSTTIDNKLYAECPATFNTTNNVNPSNVAFTQSSLDSMTSKSFDNAANKSVTINFVRDVAGKDK